ncbi:cytochrome P450 family protein [Ceratobasidium sp. AG-Ba]|nr:cytochrome P450 family protein [Ceratobasidium sp. AG-Ba]
MPTEYEHLGFMKIGEALKSDIFSLSALGTLIIVVNSAEDADNLLEKRSNIYSDRFCPPMLAEPSLMNLGKLVTLLGYNDRWKKSRRLLHPLVHKQAIETFYPALGHHARLLVQRLLIRSGEAITSETLDSELYRNLAATLTESIYGYSIRTSDDSFAMSLKELAENATRACLPSNFLVNVFPMLVHVPGWMPGAGWKRAAQKWREQQESTTNAAYEWTRAQMSQGKAGNTIISSVLQHAEELGVPTDEKEDYVKQLAVTLFTGVPHSCFEDDVYKGYRIPKGAIVFANVWAITRNTTVYPDPESFNPDRYLDPKVPIPPTFGFGRRSCPGVHYARASLFIAITTILATFDISYAKDAKGNDIVPVPESTNDLV